MCIKNVMFYTLACVFVLCSITYVNGWTSTASTTSASSTTSTSHTPVSTTSASSTTSTSPTPVSTTSASSTTNSTISSTRATTTGASSNTAVVGGSSTASTSNGPRETTTFGATCPPGYIVGGDLSVCDPCPLDTYQPVINANPDTPCVPCPDNTGTRAIASSSLQQCERYCPSGEELNGDICIPCPRGSYKDNTVSQTVERFGACVLCNITQSPEYTTNGNGSQSENECYVPICQEGEFIEASEGLFCEKCEFHTYQPVAMPTLETFCLYCDLGTWTLTEGAVNKSECLTNLCPAPVEIPNGYAIRQGGTANYFCNQGYAPNGITYSYCLQNGSWSDNPPSCDVIDCGYPRGIELGYYALLEGTNYGAIALYYCIDGYHISNGANKIVCQSNSTWTGAVGTCALTVCPKAEAPANGNVTVILATIEFLSKDNLHYLLQREQGFSGTRAIFSCNEGFSLIGWEMVTCLPPGQWSRPFPKCETVLAKSCPEDTDRYGTTWNQTNAGTLVSTNCPQQLLGNVTRNCTIEGKWRLPVYTCINREISEAVDKVDAVIDVNATSEVKSSVVSDVLKVLLESTTSVNNDTDRELYDGEIAVITATLEKVADISHDIVVTSTQSRDFIDTASNLLNPENSEAFKSLQENLNNQDGPETGGADRILSAVGSYASTIVASIELSPNETRTHFKVDNLEMEVSELSDGDTLQFPSNANSSATRLTIPSRFLKGASSYSGVLYYNLSEIMAPVLIRDNSIEFAYKINTPVLALQLFNTTDTPQESFQISLSFNHFTNDLFDPACSFWNYSKSMWDTSGCTLVADRSTEALTVCSCNHLTNFAVLMNPFSAENVDTVALGIITTIACSLSTFCLVVTITIHAIFWRYLKSDRAVLLVNLSVALVISYIVFLAGVEQTDHETGCTITAVVLHYIYLVVFLLMLSEGSEVLITVVYVFPMKSRLKWLLLSSWGVPTVIVGISIGVTQLEGYGTDKHCWLSVDGGLIWAFVGPALTIILINLVQLILIMRKMFTVKSVQVRTNFNKVKAGVRCLCVLLPLIGCTWVVGLFYVNEDMAWIQYVFAVLNGLQGMVIMIFQCVLNPQVKLTILKRWKQYQSTTSYTKPSNNSSTNNGNCQVSGKPKYPKKKTKKNVMAGIFSTKQVYEVAQNL